MKISLHVSGPAEAGRYEAIVRARIMAPDGRMSVSGAAGARIGFVVAPASGPPVWLASVGLVTLALAGIAVIGRRRLSARRLG